VVKKGRGFKKDERNLYNSVKEWAKGLKLSISERGALIEYIENGDYINEILRNDSRVSSFGLGYIPWYVRKIDGVMGRSFCPRDMTLERGISRSFFNKLIEIGEGGIWRDSGYVSTAFDNSHEEFGDYFLKISVSRGTGAIPVGQFSFGDEKDEILLARGLKFKNIKLEYNTLYVKVVG
jgi:hypothetical protein